MSHWSQIEFQDAATPIMTMLIAFHDHAMLVLIMVLTFVTYAMASLFVNKYTCRNIYEAQSIEAIWTVLPAFILLFLALPSLQLLYLTDEIVEPGVTVKAIGHQWYWSYEYTDFCNVEFDSYMVNTNDLVEGQFRLLEVDNRIVLPMNIEVRMLVSAADVIHSWTVPALGVKADAIPGRLNQLSFIIRRPGLFYGQCSEICGANHSFMPIAVEAVNTDSFVSWINTFKDSE
uniref:Cytochrome c oxidase subunit 2 n=1 Tax=Platynereis cf. australis PA-2020 TaxID=2759233 RepID=A0A7G9UIY3_9ANNE|nr:cytochrome c oxidase subunit II [Platynereis cf. australis PA-2020]QNN93064.1 cytochrome c oxidase subunit 2 [Platynereis cf. australis PA-2020]QNN93077.1 cytochrome c oxidase subunit 2 [Platynereis cf. australis PA-2020]QNN93090.1 cytochrome c oxidase subunit 2 [Platynereis cf. australis PA-2020]